MGARAVDRERFDRYVERLAEVIGHADRRRPLEAYLTGLLLAGERKSVEPMAAKVDPRHVSRMHQSMHHFVANAPWEDRDVLAVARDYALAQLERHAPVGAWVVDDTSFPKKGKHSVGVAWQYCGVLGKAANCQVAVSVSLANKTMSVPAAWRLYLPEKWARDSERREETGIPEDVGFLEKWRIALEEIDQLLAEDLPPAPVVADAGYGRASGRRGRGPYFLGHIRGGDGRLHACAPMRITHRSRHASSPTCCRARPGRRSDGARERRGR
jgi:SRSO17 transposase